MAQSTAELPRIDEGITDALHETARANPWCCCFLRFPCSNWGRVSISGREQQLGVKSRWLDKGKKAFKRVRQWSELVAGLKWRTFIRRFRKTAGRDKPVKFCYSPLSYALNFDEGQPPNTQFDADMLFPGVSSRYVAAAPTQNSQSNEATPST